MNRRLRTRIADAAAIGAPGSIPARSDLSRRIGVRRSAAKRHRVFRWFVRGVAALLLLWIAFLIALRFVPLPAALFAPPPASLELLDRHGKPLREVRTDDGSFSRRVSYEQIPQSLIDATLAAEDKRFWRHNGVDWRASLRAAWGFVKNRRVVSGGSTVTQQLIKLAQPRPRTLRTKCIEAVQAIRLEQVWDKQRILAEYLNRLDYGNLTTGAAEAAGHYFGKPLRDLSTAEAALLAGLPQSPGRLNPRTRFERAQKRQQWILTRLEANGQLTDAERKRASAEPLRLADGRRVFQAPHFVDLVLASWEDGHRSKPDTTLDLELNRFVERALRRQLDELRAQNVRDGAVVVIENCTGDVLALVGSGDYFAPQGGQVNGAWAPRSAGSTLKPFTYLLAFERGATPASIVDDLPAEFATSTGVFAPANYNQRCYGPMRYRLALANSLNISAVKVLESVGGAEVLQARLRSLGLTTVAKPAEHYGLGLTIGNAEVRLLELVNAYAALARLGEFRPWRLVRGGSGGAGERGSEEIARRHSPTPSFPHSLTPSTENAWLVADILADNNARAMAFGAESSLRFDFPVACKTGTSSDFRDNWALGFTPEFTVGVWTGNFDGTPMRGVSGVSGAAPVLREVFEELHARFGTTWFAMPTNIVERLVHPLTGKLVTPERAGAVREKFLANALPPVEVAGDYDAAGRVRLSSSHQSWLASGDNWIGRAAVADLAGEAKGLRVLSPQPGTTFFMDPDLPASSRVIPLRAEGGADLLWESPSLECSRGPTGPVALMSEGRHKLTVVCGETGRRAETWVEVKGL